MENIRGNSKDFLIVILGSFLIFSVSIKGWINYINADLNSIYTILVFLLFFTLCLLNLDNLLNYFKYLLKRNFKSLDFNILMSFFIFFVLQQKVNLEALSFLSIYFYINSIVFCSHNFYRDLSYIFISIIVAGILTALGVMLGVVEAIFLETNNLFKIKIDYPGLLSFNKHFSGFQFTYNYTAYLIIAALGVIGLLRDKDFLYKVLVFIFLLALLLTQAKISYLFVALLVVFSLKVKFLRDYRYPLAIVIALGYLLLAHLTFKLAGSELNLSYYIREEKFTIFDVQVYSTLFFWLKEIFFEYAFIYNLSEISIAGYLQNTKGTEPHSLLISSYLFGGIIFLILIFWRLILNLIQFLQDSKNYNAYLMSLVLTLLIESFIWDAYDSPIFWLVILLCPFYNKFIEERSKLNG